MVNIDDLHGYVGQPPFTSDKIYETTPAGVVMGLAWTAMGGNTLYVEAASVEAAEGKGSLRLTGEQPSCLRLLCLLKTPAWTAGGGNTLCVSAELIAWKLPRARALCSSQLRGPQPMICIPALSQLSRDGLGQHAMQIGAAGRCEEPRCASTRLTCRSGCKWGGLRRRADRAACTVQGSWAT